MDTAALVSENYQFPITGYRLPEAAFTLMEVMLTLAIIALLAGISMPLFNSFHARTDLDVAASAVASGLRRANTRARAQEGDTSWGLYVQTGTITTFQGASYASRTSGLDETYTIANNITPSGVQEVVFDKFTGETSDTGTITLTSSSGEAQTITVNGKGMVEY